MNKIDYDLKILENASFSVQTVNIMIKKAQSSGRLCYQLMIKSSTYLNKIQYKNFIMSMFAFIDRASPRLVDHQRSVIDLLQEVLELVVPLRPPIIQTTVYQVIAELLNILRWVQSLLQLVYCLFTLYKAAHALSMA